MSTNHDQFEAEQLRVARVLECINDRLDNLKDELKYVKGDVVSIRQTFWDDVTVNVEDASEEAETAASIKQQAELLSERERSYRRAHKQAKILQRLQQSPYFGRIDFQEKGELKADQVYLGTGSLLDDDGMEFLIYDWRAPISSLYYDYPPGEAEYKTPDSTISGELELKRQFIIRGPQIKSMFDTGVTIGDELLKEVLGKQADSQMRSIVATIQREQNRIIRNEHSRLLVVQGAAGSGKTSAALQRVAYLLYRYRGTLQAEQIVLFSPNPMFNNYVSTVLPELGEENMQQVTYQEFLEHRLEKEYAVEDPFTLLEYEYSAMNEPEYTIRLQGIQYKSSASFLAIIERYVDYLSQQGLQFKDLTFNDKVIVAGEEIGEYFYSLERSYSIPNRIEIVKDWLLKRLSDISKQERNKTWVEDAIELLDKEDYLWAHQELKRRRGKQEDEEVFDDFDAERNLLASKLVQEHFKPLRKMVKQLEFIHLSRIYAQLFEDGAIMEQLSSDEERHADWERIASDTVMRLHDKIMPYEDATPFLDLQGRLEGVQVNTNIRHVFIDEGQDYSPYQYFYIRRMFPRSKITVLGDFNQAIFTHTGMNNGLQALLAHYDTNETEMIVLARSYRSTRPIVEFTRQLIEGGQEIEPFNRDGNKPTITYISNEAELSTRIAAHISLLQQEGYESIAVICKTTEESQQAHKLLSSQLSILLVHKETSVFEGGAIVIPAYLAKGVEFDAVIIFNASTDQYSKQNERKLFYTACTRAMHELHLYYTNKLSPFVTEASDDSYTWVK
ncbi:UvrD-helicase domain-containing protein [Paenibacillus sp. SC116]|uniref:RNA polymerase recycling motor HelD n=1 Tax=Paenibacillus sp. SC116 TaxID=2968986 RepID=UPI00215AC4C7|nr:RNA polymerase recycling motor HelD [Paenibacillus sp. SC116]MCR8845695.1 UvrD-helicase domain-containing protein [Paenibacillus sp. SC116]